MDFDDLQADLALAEQRIQEIKADMLKTNRTIEEDLARLERQLEQLLAERAVWLRVLRGLRVYFDDRRMPVEIFDALVAEVRRIVAKAEQRPHVHALGRP